MKKLLVTFLTLCVTTFLSVAQQQIETYSSTDVNHDTEVNAEDVVTVVNHITEVMKNESQVVTAEQLNVVLKDIYDAIAQLNGTLSTVKDIVDPFNSHDYVDLGLKDSNGKPIYWATCNLGATTSTQPGNYYAWGEIETKSEYKVENYSDYDIESTSFMKYNTNGGHIVLEPQDDVVSQTMGGLWRIPTSSEIGLLISKCEWTLNKAKTGYTVKGPNGKTIFLPFAGCMDTSVQYKGTDGRYWSSSLDTFSTDSSMSNVLYISETRQETRSMSRFIGRTIRAVCVPKQ